MNWKGFAVRIAMVTVALPLIGDIELASAMVFDLGIYVVVVGVVMVIVGRLGALSGSGGRGT